MKKVSGKSYTKEYKVEALKLAKEIGTKKAAEELVIPKGTLSGWVNAAKKGDIDPGKGWHTPANSLTLAGELKIAKDRIKELEKENAQIRKEREFLEEASRFFAASRKK